ncbi:mcm10 replication factor domain-containing protein [Ditylenchus destructor]|nr:mcm10 replication factor domain-containing protein [Ditylenchus destructor]
MESDKLSELLAFFDSEDANEEESTSLIPDVSATKTPCSSNVTNAAKINRPVPTNNFADSGIKRNSLSIASDLSLFDPDFGIRVSVPQITLQTANTYCSGMKKVKASMLRSTNVPTEEWCTMAVIVDKTECRKSANDKEYMIWRVSDLINIQGDPHKVLLFGDCVKNYWKLQTGTVIIMTNAQLADPAKNSKGEVTLKLFKATQLLEIGYCPDFGHCKATKATDGNRCTNFVNISKSEYCAFHVQSAVRKLSALRGTFNRTPNPVNKAHRDSAIPPQETPRGLITVNRNSDKKYVTPNSAPNLGRALPTKAKLALTNLPASQSYAKRSTKPSATPKENFDPRLSATIITTSQPKSLKEFIKQNDKPKLASRALSGTVDLSSPQKKTRTQIQEEIKIKRAAAILRNSANTTSQQGTSKDGIDSNVPPKKRTLFGTSLSEDEIRALREKRSKYDFEAVEVEKEREEKYFANREVEEKVESSATTLMEIKNCKVITCKSCNYTAIHQSTFCKTQGHDIYRHTADKRFFKCKDCHQRLICFEVLPTKPCQRCFGKHYERVAMRDERKVQQEKLLIRGEERTFVNT